MVLVPIRYSDAKGVADKVNQILTAAGQASGKAGMRNFKILTDDRTNSVIIFGPPRTISDVHELVKKFDVASEDPSTQATIHVRPLDYADSKKLATTLSSLAGGNKSGGARRPPILPESGRPPSSGGEPTIADLGDNVKITADEATNSLLITGSRANYNALNSIIRKLDMRRAQVFIEADILDLNSSGSFAAGTSIFAGSANKDGTGTKTIVGWQAGGGGTGGGGMAALITALASAQGQPAGTVNTNAIQGVASAFSSNLAIGILSGQSVNVPGIGEVTPGAIINLMKEDINSRNLASPHILTSNNEEAVISAGQKLLFKTSVTSGVGSISQQIQKEDVDTTLTIKPNISNSDYVTLNFQVEANRVVGQNADNLPTIGKRKTKQVVTVKNGQTVVISGLMSQDQREVFQKIPLLGDIPVLGWLFRNTSISNVKNNLVIFLTPHIIHGAEDLAAVYKSKMKERNDYFEQVFGKKYAKDDFYRKLPTDADGEYRPNEEDKAEDRRQAKTQEELRRMIDAGSDEDLDSKKKKQDNDKPEELLTVPVPTGSEVAPNSPVETPAPLPAPSVPEPVNPDENPEQPQPPVPPGQ